MATQRPQSKTAAIVNNPKICGGSPTIEGTRIRVSDIVCYQRMSDGSIAAIIESLPHLTTEQVEAALVYYQRHRAAIEQEIKEEEALYAEALWQQRHST